MVLQIPLVFLEERSGESGSIHSYESPLCLCAFNVLYRRSPSVPPSHTSQALTTATSQRCGGAGTEWLTFKYLSAAEKVSCALDANYVVLSETSLSPRSSVCNDPLTCKLFLPSFFHPRKERCLSRFWDQRNPSGFPWPQLHFILRRMRGSSTLAFCWPTCSSWSTGEYLHLPSRQLFPAELLSEKNGVE